MTTTSSALVSALPPHPRPLLQGGEAVATSLLLHGFTRDARMWLSLVDGFAPDLPGHGTAAAPAPGTTFDAVVDALAARIRYSAVVGYSMGARLALSLAIRHPAKVHALVLDGGSLGLETDAERTVRAAHDARWAKQLREEGIEAFAAAWEAQPLFGKVGNESVRHQDPHHLAAALDVLGKAQMPWLGESARRVRCPVLLLNGEHDTRGLDEAARIAERIPHARRATIPGHHAAHAESPNAWRACVTSFLEAAQLTPRPLEAT